MSRFGKLVEEQAVLLKYAYEKDLKDAIMWIEEHLEGIAEHYDMSLYDLLYELKWRKSDDD